MWVPGIEPSSSNSRAMSPAFAMTLHLVFFETGSFTEAELTSILAWLGIKPPPPPTHTVSICLYPFISGVTDACRHTQLL